MLPAAGLPGGRFAAIGIQGPVLEAVAYQRSQLTRLCEIWMCQVIVKTEPTSSCSNPLGASSMTWARAGLAARPMAAAMTAACHRRSFAAFS